MCFTKIKLWDAVCRGDMDDYGIVDEQRQGLFLRCFLLSPMSHPLLFQPVVMPHFWLRPVHRGEWVVLNFVINAVTYLKAEGSSFFTPMSPMRLTNSARKRGRS